MAGFEENIVRDYFELHGFLIRQARKFQSQSRKKLAEEEIDMLVHNPFFQSGGREPNFILFASELQYIERAIVTVRSWDSLTKFTPNLLKSSSEVLKFLEKNVLKNADELFQNTEIADESKELKLTRILVLPGLPTSEPYRGECMKLLQEHGINGIISFRAMLLDIIQKIEVNRNYQKSHHLQVLKTLKNYDLLKDSQMALFND